MWSTGKVRQLTIAEPWQLVTETARRRGLPLDEVLRTGVSPTKLDKAEAKLGIRFHPDVRELYGLADGLRRIHGHNNEPSLLGFSFPGLQEAVRRTTNLRDAAEEYGPTGAWRASWLKVFDDIDNENFLVDCSDGSVWYVYAAADETYQVAPDLATFFGVVTIAADRNDVRYQLDGDYFETPDGEVWEAPIKSPWRPT
jgi:cell wall assembly regulator SMI1